MPCCASRIAIGPQSRASQRAAFAHLPQQSWQTRPTCTPPPPKPTSPIPHLPADQHTAALPSSKKQCSVRDAQPYGSLEPLSFDFCTAVHIAAYYGHWHVIRQFIESSQCDPCQLFASRNSQVRTFSHDSKLWLWTKQSVLAPCSCAVGMQDFEAGNYQADCH